MRQLLLAAIALALAAGAGCGPAPKTEDITVIKVDPLAQVKSTLTNYANGQPLGSEVTTFPNMVETVKKVDADKGAALEKGFADMQKPKANVRAIAKDLLAKLG
jgi:hypothetical protein